MSAVEGWTSVTVEDCCEILDRKRIPVNGTDRENRRGEIPYYGANGLQGYIDDFIFNEPLILIAEDGGRFDEYCVRPIAYRISGKSWVNNHAHVLRAKKGFFQDAIFYSLEHKDIQSVIVGGTRSKLNQSALKKITFQLPTSEIEQTSIATIISTVDSAIEKTEALISKHQRIKVGLMQDLFTRGVNEQGKLRFEQTDKFKDSKIGRIPVDWNVSRLESVGTWASGGTPSKANASYWGDDIPWVCPKDMKTFDLAATIENLTRLGARLGSREMPAKTVFIVVRGMILAHTFPVCITSQSMSFNQDVKGIVVNTNIESRFFAYWLASQEHNLLKITTTATHGTKRFDMSELFDVSSKEEQTRIVARLDTAESQIDANKKKAAKLRSLKTALMQVLLTGNKRVQLVLEPAKTHLEK
jgi:type I restriction enzyme S subunit